MNGNWTCGFQFVLLTSLCSSISFLTAYDLWPATKAVNTSKHQVHINTCCKLHNGDYDCTVPSVGSLGPYEISTPASLAKV